VLQDAARQLGPNSNAQQQLDNKIECPEESQLLWGIYCRLSGNFTLAELQAYCEMTGYKLTPNQVDLLTDIHRLSND